MSKPIIDLATLEEVKPAEDTKKEESPDAKKEEETEKSDDEPEEVESKEETPGEGSEEGESEKDKESDGEQQEEKKEGEGEEPKPVEINDFIADNYKEKYGIENEDQLVEVLDRLDTVIDENESLRAELKTAKETKAAFKSEKQAKIAEFLERFDPESFGEGLQTTATLMAMDVEKADRRAVLQEEYIISHPEFTRDQARRKFEKEYTRKYVVDEAKFEDDPAALKEAQEDAELDLISAHTKAKKALLKEQENLKASPAEKAEPKKEDEAVTKGIERSVGEFEKTFSSFEKNKKFHLNFKSEDGKEFPVVFDSEQLAAIKATVGGWLKTPSIYNEKGELKDKTADTPTRIMQAGFALFGSEIIAKVIEAATMASDVKKAEEIAKRKPDRKGGPEGSGDIKNMDPDAQFVFLAKKKKAEREQGGRKAA